MALVDPALSYFVAVIETGSIHGAARRLFITPSAISRQVARLEREVGTPLLERLPHGVTPTAAGRAFHAFARRTLDEAAALAGELRGHSSARVVVTVAGTFGVTHSLLPRVAGRFLDDHPAARLILHRVDGPSATSMVLDGTADVAVTFSVHAVPGVTVRHSEEAPLAAAVHRDHPLARMASVSVRELVGYPLAMGTLRTTNRILLDSYSAAHGRVVEPVLESDDPMALMRFVREHGAVTLLSPVTLDPDYDSDLVCLPLQEPELHRRTLQVQCRAGRELPAPTEAFVELAVTALAQRDAPGS